MVSTSPDPGITPFTLSVTEVELSDLRQRLQQTRWPDQLPGQEWVYGAELSEVQSLVAYWIDEFDWASAEASINAWPQFTTTLDGENVHFIHARSARKDAQPLLLSHGWPGSIAEFLHLIEPLTNPEDDATPAFHVVVPSLPGFGLSGPTVTTGVSPARIAQMWATLMARLGYTGYLAQGGDWGAIITGLLGQLDPDHCAGIHLNMLPLVPTEELMADITDAEQGLLLAAMGFQGAETGYQSIQGTKPQTLAFAHADSPSGLLAWIYEKFRTWSDCDGDVFSSHDRDRLLTNVCLYWLTNTAGSAARIYYEFDHADGRALATKVTVPTAVADFPKEMYRCSRRWAESVYNVIQWSEFDEGGHFAALEQPESLVQDIRAFGTALR